MKLSSLYFFLPFFLFFLTAENSCELNCMPRGENFYYRHRSSVADGTPCHPGRRDICVGGVCKVASCTDQTDEQIKEEDGNFVTSGYQSFLPSIKCYLKKKPNKHCYKTSANILINWELFKIMQTPFNFRNYKRISTAGPKHSQVKQLLRTPTPPEGPQEHETSMIKYTHNNTN